MRPEVVVVTGIGLFTGQPSRVVLSRRPGPLTLGSPGRTVSSDGLRVASTEWATTVDADGCRVRTVEHLLAACGGLGIHVGLGIEVDGVEVPLLDGAALQWCEALDALCVVPSCPSLVVLRDEVVAVEDLWNSRHYQAPTWWEVSYYRIQPGDKAEGTTTSSRRATAADRRG